MKETDKWYTLDRGLRKVLSNEAAGHRDLHEMREQAKPRWRKRAFQHREEQGQKSWVRSLRGYLQNDRGQYGWSKPAGVKMRSETWPRSTAAVPDEGWPGL